METILQSGINLIVALQTFGAWLTTPMRLFTFLGSQEFLLLILPMVYWCIDAGIGARIGVMLLITGSLNDVLKLAFHEPRPYWVSTQVKALTFEPTFSTPSGHAQTSVGIWGLIAATIKRPWAWIIAIGLILLVGFSRVHLGVHFPHDVLFGWAVGALVLWVFVNRADGVIAWIKSKNLWTQIGLAFGVSLLMVSISAVVFAPLQGWELPAAWVENVLKAGAPEPLNPLNLSYNITDAGAIFGLLAGLALTHFRGGFSAAGPVKLRVARFVIGLVGLIVLYYGLSKVFPSDGSIISSIWRYVRYALISGWITGGAPFVFLRLKLAQKD